MAGSCHSPNPSCSVATEHLFTTMLSMHSSEATCVVAWINLSVRSRAGTEFVKLTSCFVNDTWAWAGRICAISVSVCVRKDTTPLLSSTLLKSSL